MHQQAFRIDQDMSFLPLIFLPASYPCGSMQAPFFRAQDALAIDDAVRRTGLALDPLTAFHIERVMNAIEHAMVGP